jgi:hypothetical protein
MCIFLNLVEMSSGKHRKWIQMICVAGLFLLSCNKYESSISGTVEYINISDNEQITAPFAVVSKCIYDHDTVKKISSVRADANGYFIFEHATKEKCFLHARFLQQDSLIYEGETEEFSVSGEDKIEKNILLFFSAKNDTLP